MARRERKGTLFLLLVALFGGGIGAFGWFADDPRSFSWDLPPLASRMLAAAGWAFAVPSFLAIRRPTWPRVSLVLLALTVYLMPIALAAVIFHLDRFDASAPITYAFFLITGTMAVAAIWFLIMPSPALRNRAGNGAMAPGWWARGCLVATSIVSLPWALALFVTDHGAGRLVWAWPGDLLTSRLISTMLLTIGIASLASLRSAERARLMLAMNITYGIGVVAAGAMNAWFGKPLPLGYIFGLGANRDRLCCRPDFPAFGLTCRSRAAFFHAAFARADIGYGFQSGSQPYGGKVAACSSASASGQYAGRVFSARSIGNSSSPGRKFPSKSQVNEF